MVDTIIIGAGPAGLTAALYLLRANKKILILEANSYGGQIVEANKIENYPGILEIDGFSWANNLYKQVENLGGEIKYETVTRVDRDKTVTTNKGCYKGKTIIIATGVKKRKLNLPREEEFRGKGISYCATCDGNFYKDKVVAVVGGGNTALEEALYLKDIAKKVYVIHRREEFRGSERTSLLLKLSNNVEFIFNTTIKALNGKERLESITLINNDGSISEAPIEGLFIAIGQVPNNQIFLDVVTLDEDGYIETTNEVYTKTLGIYAAGDTRKKFLRQLTTAVSDGSMAASAAIKELNDNNE